MITDQTQLGLLQEPSEGKVGNQKGSARQILDSIVGSREKAQHFPHCFVWQRGESMRIVTQKWSSDWTSWSNWVGLDGVGKAKFSVLSKRKNERKKIWENRIVRIMEARRKEPLFWDSKEKANDVQVENGWSKDGNLRQIRSKK